MYNIDQINKHCVLSCASLINQSSNCATQSSLKGELAAKYLLIKKNYS